MREGGWLPTFLTVRAVFDCLICRFPWHSDALIPSVALERMTVERLAGAGGGCGRERKSRRDGNEVRQKVIATLGRFEDLLASGQVH
jgi:hypothetical protein